MTREEIVLRGLAATRQWQEDFYRDLHAHPELSGEEHRTAVDKSGPRNEGVRRNRRITGQHTDFLKCIFIQELCYSIARINPPKPPIPPVTTAILPHSVM